MKILLVLCVLVCVYNASCDIEEDCKDTMDQLRSEVEKMMDDGEAPSCIQECGLAAFRETDEGDRKEKMKELRKHIESLDEDKKKEALECMHEIKEDLMERMKGRDMDEDCMKKIKEQSDNVMEYIIKESE